MQDCMFCKIIKGEIPSHKVYEDKDTVAILDIRPINAGHTLVVPKKHSTDLLDIDDEDLKKAIVVVKRVAKAIKEAVNAQGINLGMNNGKAAGQLVFHPHLHVMPRFENDGYKHWYGKDISQEELTKIAKKIKEKIN